MQVFTYQGTPEVFEGMAMIPGKEYAIQEIGYADGGKKYKGILGTLAAVIGIRKPLHNCYWVRIYSDDAIRMCAYSTKETFNSIWRVKKLA